MYKFGIIKCQNEHTIWEKDPTKLGKIVCPECEIVVKDREGPAGVYQLRYLDITEGYTIIPEKFRKEWSKSVFDVPGVFKWFCSSLSIHEAEIIAKEAENRHLAISKKAMVNLIEEMIPQLRKMKKVNVLVNGKIIGTVKMNGFYQTDPVVKGVIEFHKEFPIAQLKISKDIVDKANIAVRARELQMIGRSIRSSNGYTCSKCKEHYPYAEQANQDDGTFMCYGCRNNR